MSYLVLGNWKSNGDMSQVQSFLEGYAHHNVDALRTGLALPFHLLRFEDQFEELWLGAQNVSAFGAGAFTGEITADMLVDCGCRFSLVGHSERRAYFGETPGMTTDKLRRLVEVGIYPVFCIGETLEERETGKLKAVLAEQLAPLAALDAGTALAVAYEPVWAIGTGVAAEPEDVAQAHALVKDLLKGHGFERTPVLYGGSVKPANAGTLSAIEHVDGFLVGGASLKADSFNGIVSGFCTGKGL